MSNSSVIFWFSGTGNSLYAAKKIAGKLNNIPLTQITNESPTEAVGGENAKIGFVFPSYYGNMPRAVRAFVEKLTIEPNTYIFAVVTMGSVGQGSVGALDKTLKEKGFRLNYGKGIVMPANYVIKYNPADSGKSDKKISEINKRIDAAADAVLTGTQSVKTVPVTAKNLYKNIESLDVDFKVNNSCTSCGLCKKVCPVRNIKLVNGKPEWLHHCEHCVACISWCPSQAIEYGNKTQSRRRYCNPRIKAEELIRNDSDD